MKLEPADEYPLDEKPRSYLCTVCDKRFVKERSLIKHKRMYWFGGCGSYCAVCDKRFAAKKDFQRHKQRHLIDKLRGRDTSYSCTVCDKDFASEASLKAHQLTHTAGGNRHACAQCGESFTYAGDLSLHVNTVHSADHSCTDCGRRFRSERMLKEHRESHSGQTPFKCTVCGEQFATSCGLGQHNKDHEVHSMEDMYSCDSSECDAVFSDPQDLTKHMESQHPRRGQSCKKTFANFSSLQAHNANVCTGKRPFDCHSCGKSFKHKSWLDSHILTHTGAKPYSCTRCSDRFAYSNQLKTHLLKFHGEGTWVICHICLKKFCHIANLNAHLLCHEAVKPYFCERCSKTFCTANELQYHQRVHSDEKMFCCGLCGEYFKNKNSIATHLKICSNRVEFADV